MNKTALALDIVIVNKNAGGLLRRCLNSLCLCNQNGFSLHSVNVIDNDSSDGSADDLSFPLPLKVHRLQQNIGYGAACNLGASMGHASAILFLNPDVVLPPDSLQSSLLALSAHESVGLLGVRMQNEDGSSQPSRMLFPQPKHLIARSLGLNRINKQRFPTHFGVNQNQSALCDCVLGAFLLVRREAFECIGGFDPHFFLYYEEIDLAQRLRQAGYTCLYYSEVCILHTGGASAKTMRAFALQQSVVSRIRYARRYFNKRQARAVAVCTFCLEPITRSILSIARQKNPVPIWGAYRKAARRL